jgi:hypothetical protein
MVGRVDLTGRVACTITKRTVLGFDGCRPNTRRSTLENLRSLILGAGFLVVLYEYYSQAGEFYCAAQPG